MAMDFLSCHYFFSTLLLILFTVQKVGCDNIVGSGKVVDRCGVCGGNNQTCNIMKGFYTPTRLPKGYNTILTFPSGACNINVTEIKASRNFLALKKDDDTYIINGRWPRSSPGQYKASDTVFYYNRHSGKSCVGECLHAQGPISEKLILQLLAYDRNPGIFYEYTIPSGMVHKILHKMKNVRPPPPPPRQVHPQPQAYSGQFHPRRPNIRTLPQHRQLPKTHATSNRTHSYWRRQRLNGRKVINRRPGPHYIPSYASNQALGGSSQTSYNHQPRQQQAQHRTNRNHPRYTYPRNDQQYRNSTIPHRNYLRYPAQRRRFNSTLPRGMYPRYSRIKYPRLNSSSAARGTHGRQYLSSQANRTYSRSYNNHVFTPSKQQTPNRIPYRNNPQRPVLSQSRPVFNQPDKSGAQAQSSGTASNTNTGSSDEEITYQWNIVGFTECSETCGGGTQETRILCVKMNSQVVVTDDNCDRDEKLSIQTTACNTKPCQARWTPSEWSPCSVSCGEGKKTRHVECQEKISPTFSKRVSATVCLNQTRLPTVTKCVEKPCSQWVIKDWSKCSVECGLGLRKREVRCVGADDKVLTDRKCTEPKPTTSDVCDMGSCAKAWFFTEWSKECSASCGHGLLHRKVHCSADNGESLPDNKCKQNTKPKSEKACKSERPCGGLWFTGPWSECTATCGQGVRVRDVTCVNKLNRHSFTVAEETNCLKEEKPAAEELCETLPECPPEWYTTEWTECSASCGTGSKSRETKCVDAKLKQSILCDISEQPVTRQSCNTNSCLQIPLNTDPMCRDHMKQCKMVVQARLCPYPYYKQRCCETCRKHHHHHHPS